MWRFLRETWELWYWAMFCPLKLQMRMNEWASDENHEEWNSTSEFSDVLLSSWNYRFSLSSVNSRFKYQYLLLVLFLCLPLFLEIIIHHQVLDLLLLPILLLIAYSTGFWFISLGLHIPVLWSLGYSGRPEVRLTTLDLAINNASSTFTLGAIIAVLVATLIGIRVADNDLQIEVLDRAINSRAFRVAVNVALFMSFFLAIIVDRPLAIGMGLVLLGVVLVDTLLALAIVLQAALIFVVINGLINIATLPLHLFLLTCCLAGFCMSSAQRTEIGIITGGILTAFGSAHLGWISLLAIPAALSSYYRLLPDYLILTLISLLPSIPLVSSLQPKPLQLLYLLPPHTTELLWLPLPNHDRILAAAFRTDTSAALATFQQMQASPLPGLPDTIKQALPQILADQLAAVDTIGKLVLTAQNEHPLLPLLVPTFYQQDTELQEQPSPPGMSGSRRIGFSILSKLLIQAALTAFPAGISLVSVLDDLDDGTDINKLLPRLQAVAKDVNAALNAGSAALRDRGLERIVNNLLKLQLQLPGLGLKAHAIKRWQPVLERWQRVIELEEQQKQSQGELLNPFQYGNPLRRDRSHLFKGRQAFADNIVRLVLDRNRPTLVLHGPRRCGKSSFLLNLPRLLPGDLMPVYLDMQEKAATGNEADFWYSLVRAMHRDSRSQGVELPKPQRKEFLDNPYTTLRDWLDEALPQLGDKRLLLNLDEFEKIGTAINQKRLSLDLFDELRHLIQHYDQLGFLFSGVQTLDELGPNWSSYFISVVPIEMLYLEPHEAEDLLVNPDPEFTLRYDKGIVEEILTLTRCHPYLLQLIGWSLVKLANENHTQLVTSDLLQAAIPEAFTNGQPYFTNVWTEFTGTSPAEVAAGQEFLLALAQGHQTTSVAGDETAQAARRRLLRYHVIEHIDGSDRFEVPLIERWVRERAVRN